MKFNFLRYGMAVRSNPACYNPVHVVTQDFTVLNFKQPCCQ